MEERWRELERIDERIQVNRRINSRIKNEIHILTVQLENNDTEYKELNAQKLYLGKKIYGDPEVRKELVKSGKSCSNKSVRKAAQKLQEYNNDIKWENDVKVELISICMLIDRGEKIKVENPNFLDFMAKIGKMGYVRTTNY